MREDERSSDAVGIEAVIELNERVVRKLFKLGKKGLLKFRGFPWGANWAEMSAKDEGESLVYSSAG
jgi:hypothetical protein